MEKDFKPIKSVYNTNDDVIKNIMKLYNIEQFDLDCTYSSGNFWKNLKGPKIKTDLFPKNDTIFYSSMNTELIVTTLDVLAVLVIVFGLISIKRG